MSDEIKRMAEYAEELRRQIEQRYLNRSIRPGAEANIGQTRTRVVEHA